MTLNELLQNNPAAGNYSLYIDTRDHYVKICDAWESLGIAQSETGPVLVLKPEQELVLPD